MAFRYKLYDEFGNIIIMTDCKEAYDYMFDLWKRQKIKEYSKDIRKADKLKKQNASNRKRD